MQIAQVRNCALKAAGTQLEHCGIFTCGSKLHLLYTMVAPDQAGLSYSAEQQSCCAMRYCRHEYRQPISIVCNYPRQQQLKHADFMLELLLLVACCME